MNMRISELKHSIKSYTGLFVKNAFLVAFLFILLNLFLGVGVYVKDLAKQVQNKMGVYLYLNDTPWNETKVYNQVLAIKKDLEEHDVQVKFVSKEDAFNFLEKKLPNITENFNKFDIENPLQSTLYLTFKDKKSYEYTAQTLAKNKEIISNYNDIKKGTSLHAQNNRVIGIMNLSYFAQIFIYSVIVILFVLLLVLLRYFLKTLTHHFHQDMYRKKIMGATKLQIIVPLLSYTMLSVFLGVVISIFLSLWLGVVVNHYVLQYFQVETYKYLFSSELAKSVIIAIIVAFVVAKLVAYRYLYKVDKELK